MLKNKLNISRSVYLSIEEMSLKLAIGYECVRSAIRRLIAKGIIKRYKKKAENKFNNYNRYSLLLFIDYSNSDKKPIYKYRSSLKQKNINNPSKNAVASDQKTEKPYLPDPSRAPKPTNRKAKMFEVKKLVEIYGLGELKGKLMLWAYWATQKLKLSVNQWKWIFQQAKDNKFLNGTATKFKATLAWLVCEGNIRKVLNNSYKEYFKKPSAQPQPQPAEATSSDPIATEKPKKSEMDIFEDIVMKSSFNGQFDFPYMEKELASNGILDKVISVIKNIGEVRRRTLYELKTLLAPVLGSNKNLPTAKISKIDRVLSIVNDSKKPDGKYNYDKMENNLREANLLDPVIKAVGNLGIFANTPMAVISAALKPFLA